MKTKLVKVLLEAIWNALRGRFQLTNQPPTQCGHKVNSHTWEPSPAQASGSAAVQRALKAGQDRHRQDLEEAREVASWHGVEVEEVPLEWPAN